MGQAIVVRRAAREHISNLTRPATNDRNEDVKSFTLAPDGKENAALKAAVFPVLNLANKNRPSPELLSNGLRIILV